MTHEAYARLKEAGLCPSCKRPVDDPKYVRCSQCRGVNSMYYFGKQEYIQAQKDVEEIRAAAAEARKREKYAKCERCVWGTYTGSNVLFCMFPNCIKEPATQPEPQQEGGE